MTAILAFLALWGCHVNPDIHRVEHLSHPGAYVEGRVLLREDADDGVVLHELGHACNWDHDKIRKVELAWRQRDA
jgi:hypothetical protein